MNDIGTNFSKEQLQYLAGLSELIQNNAVTMFTILNARTVGYKLRWAPGRAERVHKELVENRAIISDLEGHQALEDHAWAAGLKELEKQEKQKVKKEWGRAVWLSLVGGAIAGFVALGVNYLGHLWGWNH